MPIERLILGTGNNGKVHEWQGYLGEKFHLVPISELGDFEGPEETGDTFRKNAIDKAKHYAKQTGEYVLSEDGGFEVDYLDGAPGVRSRRIFGDEREGTDQELVDFIMEKMKGVPDEKRTARLVVYVAVSDPQGNIVFEGKNSIEGIVPQEALDYIEEGYPYRSTFYIPEVNKMYGELSEEEHDRLAHRRPISERLASFLLEYDRND